MGFSLLPFFTEGASESLAGRILSLFTPLCLTGLLVRHRRLF